MLGSFLAGAAGASAARALKFKAPENSNKQRLSNAFFMVQVFGITRLAGLYGLFTFLFGADTNGLIDGENEYFPVANFAGLGRADDRRHRRVHAVVRQDQFNFDFGQEIDRVFAAAVDLGMTLLATETLDFTHGHALDPRRAQGILHFFQLERLNDGFNFFHNFSGTVLGWARGSLDRPGAMVY